MTIPHIHTLRTRPTVVRHFPMFGMFGVIEFFPTAAVLEIYNVVQYEIVLSALTGMGKEVIFGVKKH
eukprot:SAG25_NODE_160_length_13390_cov_9.002708_17_plen_67_part_00